MAQPKDSKHIFQQKLWLGISNLLKEPSSQDPDQPTNYWYSENINVRTDPYAPTLNPACLKESGSVVVDFIKWMDITPASLTTYAIGDAGYTYSRTTAGSWTNLHQAPNSHGNGLQYFYGDDYLYYPGDKTIGRYGPLSSNPQFSDDFLTAQGGIPLNTASVLLASASSMYGHAADSASLSITGNLTLETYFKANSLPTTGNSMTLIGKWDESGATRSYKLDLYGVSGYFGSGVDGSLTISTNQTEAPIDSACTGTINTQALTATNANFVAGQVIFIHQTQGTGAGSKETNTIQGYTAGTITVGTPLKNTYGAGAQVRVLKQYTNVTVNTGVTWTAKAWNGTVGGILAFQANGTVTGTGNIVADGCGFRGGTGSNTSTGYAASGEGTAGVSVNQTGANGNGGGGGINNGSPYDGGGGGGGHGGAGNTGELRPDLGIPNPASGGNASDSADLTTMTLGGGGGAGGGGIGGGTGGNGGTGGGVIFITAMAVTIAGTISANGTAGTVNASNGGGGGGAGGAILIKCQTATLGTGLITATGGAGASASGLGGTNGGFGGTGINHIDYLTSYTGTTNPTLNATQDNTLVTTTTIQTRLGISNDGTAYEYLTQNLSNLTIGVWNRLSVAWTAATATAQFYLNAVLLGSSTGTKTAIHDNASLLYVGADKGASVVQDYFDGLFNDMRIWNNIQTAGQIFANNQIQVSTTSAGLAAYYTFNSVYTDGTANANTLTAVNTPTFSTDVPFPAPTTRLDIDQSFTTTGQTYTLGTTISEAAADTLTFTPADDPQKSVAFNVSAVGAGNWTVTVHDQQNRVVASQTILNANIVSAGYQEFVFTTPWRIVIGKTYHMHLTTSTGTTSKVVTSVASNFSNADFYTYFGFLVNDSLFHPAIRWLNYLVIGNERYLAKWDGAFYSPNLIAFPQGTHVRCYGQWGIYLAIGTWQERTDGTAPNVYDFATGKIYFWDGISLTYNFSIDVPEGQVNSIFGMDSNLYYYAGFRGDLMQYTGTFANQAGSFNGTKIKRIPYLSPKDYMEVYPQAMANYQGLLYMGLAGNTNSTTLPQGVYSWGTLYPQYPQSLSFDHIISTGNKGNSVSIGVVYPVQQKLLVSWQDGAGFGVDVIDSTSGVYHTQGSIQTNILDGGMVYKNGLLLKTRADHVTLNTGESITVGYKLNRETNFETSTSITDTLKQFTTNTLSNGRHTEAQLIVQLNSNGSSTPTLLSLDAQFDNLDSELAF